MFLQLFGTVVIAGIEAMFQLAGAGLLGGQGGIGWRLAAIEDYGVLDVVTTWMIENRHWSLEDHSEFTLGTPGRTARVFAERRSDGRFARRNHVANDLPFIGKFPVQVFGRSDFETTFGRATNR